MADDINPNSNWINLRGVWITNILLVIGLHTAFSLLPGISSEASWTLTNLFYNLTTFLCFHWLIGTPFDALNQGEYSSLTFWEQLDAGDQFTPSRKFLTAFPIALFLISTHYTHYDAVTFCVNVVSLLIVLIAKLPAMHKVRLFGINKKD